MGTNFDFVPSEDNPLHVYGSIHLGKSSMGWSFSFHGYKVESGESGIRRLSVESGLSIPVNVPGLWIADFSDVLRLIQSGGYIEDEYRREHSVADFIKMVTEKQAGQNHARSYPDDRNWIDSLGNSFGNYEFS